MFDILGWHTPWTWHELGAPVASLLALLVAGYALILMLRGWLLPVPVRAPGTPAEPRPGPALRAVIAVISCGTILAALCVIGRYWTGPALARWTWAWGIRWTLPVLITVIVLIGSIRREALRQAAMDSSPTPVGDPAGGS
jgi:hypothetical protein